MGSRHVAVYSSWAYVIVMFISASEISTLSGKLVFARVLVTFALSRARVHSAHIHTVSTPRVDVAFSY